MSLIYKVNPLHMTYCTFLSITRGLSDKKSTTAWYLLMRSQKHAANYRVLPANQYVFSMGSNGDRNHTKGTPEMVSPFSSLFSKALI